MLKLKLQYFFHLMWRADSLEKTLMLGKIEAGGEGHDRGWDGWMGDLSPGDGDGLGSLVCCSAWGNKDSDITEWLNNNNLQKWISDQICPPLVKVKSLSRVRLFVIPWTVAYQAPPSMGCSRQEYWSGLPFPSPGDLPNPGIEPWSPTLEADALTSEPPGSLNNAW